MLMDSSKIGKVLTYTLLPEDVDVVVSDGNLDPDIVELMHEKGRSDLRTRSTPLWSK